MTNKEKTKKSFKIISNIFFNMIIVFLAFYIVLDTFFPQKTVNIIGFKLYRIQTDSMEGKLNVNDIILITKTKEDNIKKGDIITFQTNLKLDGQLHNVPITHYIGDVYEDNGLKNFKTQTRANFIEENNTYDEWYTPSGEQKDIVYSNVIGKFVFKVPLIGVIVGKIQQVFKNPIMILLVLLNVVVVLFLIKVIFGEKIKQIKTKMKEKYLIKKENKKPKEKKVKETENQKEQQLKD